MLNTNQVIFGFILLPLAGAIACANSARVKTIITEHFLTEIYGTCTEGHIICGPANYDRVSYISRDLGMGSIWVNVSRVNNDRSYSFVSCKFENGNDRYFISTDNGLQIHKTSSGKIKIDISKLSEQGTSIGSQ